jgi:hypothetical protein
VVTIRLAWMRANFTEHGRVGALGGADSYATRLFDYEHSGREQQLYPVRQPARLLAAGRRGYLCRVLAERANRKRPGITRLFRLAGEPRAIRPHDVNMDPSLPTALVTLTPRQRH